MLSRLFIALCRSSSLKRQLWKRWYDFLAARYRNDDWTFMNYGYVPAPSEGALTLQPEDEADRYCIQLYHRVTSGANLQNKNVLEVGSGRGGGASFVKRYHSPASLVGVDFSREAIAFCRRRHHVDGLRFEEGSAESLPFGAAAFDVVLNVESSHCYGSMDAFLSEVRRVLRPGGFLLHADLRATSALPAWKAQLERCGMNIVSETDITAHVLAALDAEHERKRRLIHDVIPTVLRAPFEDFAGLRGSTLYDGFRNGTFTYRMFVLCKT